jgi:P-type Mg2+ transporter
VLDALLFSLAIAVGISPRLLPAVVSTSLAAGSRQLAKRKVLVKRLVCIEDLGDVDVLFTDKTGTLTEGSLRFMRSAGPDGTADDKPLRLGLLCNEAVVENGRAAGGNPLDVALWDSPAAAGQQAALARYHRLATLPFDHERRLVSVLAEDDRGHRMVITKGAPEGLLERCTSVPAAARTALAAEFAAGNRVIAVATKEAAGQSSPTPADEHGLAFRGILVFLDPPKPTARAALARLAHLGVIVKILTGDNPAVAAKVCADLGLPPGRVATGADIHKAGDQLAGLLAHTTVFARVSPEHKAQIVRAQRATGTDVAFLGDGVNDAVALHAADVGISVDSATDVAKDAAAVILLEKDLDVLADGVTGGRQIFANTIKYVLMGTSSNFGSMFSAAGASVFLAFLPMLPSQILLNNLLYDTSQLAIPTDEVDPELIAQPTRWDLGFIRKFMLFFGPISSIFDFATFGIMLWVFHAGPVLFHTGWFVESLATQTLVIFVIRTRRIPFFHSRPSVPLLLAAGQAPQPQPGERRWAGWHRHSLGDGWRWPGLAPAAPGVVKVVAGENFWGNIAAQIGGRHVRVTSILASPAADPRLYEADVADALAVAGGLVIENGAGYDTALSQAPTVLIYPQGGRRRRETVPCVCRPARLAVALTG